MIIYFVGRYIYVSIYIDIFAIMKIIIMNNLKIFSEIIQYNEMIVRKEFMFMFNVFYNGFRRCVFKYGGI